jgi:hypothetical protein
MRRALAALVLALAWAAPARAQAPVEGGGSFNDAPVVKPGRYTDTLRGTETTYYAVALERGQKLDVTATVSGTADVGYSLKLQIYSPAREPDPFDGEASDSLSGSDQSVALNVSGQTVGETGTTSDQYYQVSGNYYVVLSAETSATRFNPPQFDTQLQVDVTGTVQPEPTATAAPQATPEPVQAPQLPSASVRSGHGELGEAIVLALSLGGLLGFAGVRLGHLRP